MNPQLGFAFLADLPTLDLDPPKRTARSTKAGAKTPKTAKTPPAAPAAAMDVEAMARALEAHADYRVQRRLKPCLHWPGEVGAGVKTIVVLDTETTGLDASREKIIELALLRVAVDTATGLPVGDVQVYDGLEDPGKPIPAEVVAITGIQDADVQGQALDEARISEMMEGVDLVIAHNAGFDRPFVEARLPGFARLAWACSFADIDWKSRGRNSAKLEGLAAELGLFYDAHRAEMDCHALLAVLAAPLPATPQEVTCTGLAHLLRAAHNPGYRLSATNAPYEAKDLLKARGYRWNGDQRVWATRLSDDAALLTEFDWLRKDVYGGRHAAVQVEQLDALTKYSSRSGQTAYHQL
jgi:DNA polymerase-3 subunit epsilon